MHKPERITIAIPSYQRGRVLISTLEHLFGDAGCPAEILVIDQTPAHEPEVDRVLSDFDRNGRIRWIRLEKPSIPSAMNAALLHAVSPIVLFLDDDIIPAPGLVSSHASNYSDKCIWGVSGQVLQPGQEPADVWFESGGPERDMSFPFYSTRKQTVAACMAGNFSVRRDAALRIGGFDENFVGDAYRFETEFCRRLVQNGGTIVFEPLASIRHLQVSSGGTRTYGSHLRSARGDLTSGEYYFILLGYRGWEKLVRIFLRFLRAIARKYYLSRPWWLPVKVVAEIRGLSLAMKLKRQGPSYAGEKR